MLAILVLALSGGCAVSQSEPDPAIPARVNTTLQSPRATHSELSEPPIPDGGGEGIESQPSDGPTEIDCVEAESRCESGDFKCDEIVETCDVGPDGLGENPDEYDWEGG